MDSKSKFLKFFSSRFGSNFRVPGSDAWRATSKFHYLSDNDMLASLDSDASYYRAPLMDDSESFLLLQFQSEKIESDSQLWQKLLEVLQSLGLTEPKLFQVSDCGLFQVFISLTRRTLVSTLCNSLQLYLQLFGLANVQVVMPGDNFILPLQQGFRWMACPGRLKVSRAEITTEAAIEFFMAEISRELLCPGRLATSLAQRLACLDNSCLDLSSVQAHDQVAVQTESSEPEILMLSRTEFMELDYLVSESEQEQLYEHTLLDHAVMQAQGRIQNEEAQSFCCFQEDTRRSSQFIERLGGDSDSASESSHESIEEAVQVHVQEKVIDEHRLGALGWLSDSIGHERTPAAQTLSPLIDSDSGFSELIDGSHFIDSGSPVSQDKRSTQPELASDSICHRAVIRRKKKQERELQPALEQELLPQELLQLSFRDSNLKTIESRKPKRTGRKRAPPIR